MSNELTIPDNFGKLADVFKESDFDASVFTAGIGMAWPILTIKGKEWGWRFRGENHTYDAPNAAAGGAIMPVQFLDVVLVSSGKRISKVYYKQGFKDGERTPPDCWSADGLTPDPASSEKQANTCGGCRHNVFGSRVGEAGQKGKACSDNKRVAVVTAADLRNTDFGGPFMLRLPPGSFSDYSTFASVMGSNGFQPHTLITRLTFDKTPHPKIMFRPVRALTNEEARIISEHQKNPRTDEMLNDKAIGAFLDPDADVPEAAVGALPTAPAGGGGSAWDQGTVVETVKTGTVAAPPEAVTAVVTPASNDPGPMPAHLVRTEPDPAYQYTPDGKHRWKAGMAAWELVPVVAPPPPPPPPPPIVVAPPPPPAAEVLTPEQLRIQALERELAEAKANGSKKAVGRPRSKPVGPPSADTPPPPPAQVTTAGNGAAPPPPPADEPPPEAVGNAISNRIAGLVKSQS